MLQGFLASSFMKKMTIGLSFRYKKDLASSFVKKFVMASSFVKNPNRIDSKLIVSLLFTIQLHFPLETI